MMDVLLKNKIRISLLMIVVFFTALSVDAQKYKLPFGDSSFELSFGPSTLIGDVGNPLNDKYIIDTTHTQYREKATIVNSTITFGFHQELSQRFAYKVSVHSSIYESFDTIKNKSYKSDVFEATARAEYIIFQWGQKSQNSVFAHAGVGYLFSSHQYSNLVNGHLEVNNPVPIITQSLVVPFGAGYRYRINDRFRVGADLNIHYIFSDQIDGRGWPDITSGMKYPTDFTANASISLLYVIFKGSDKPKDCHCEWY